ncbi:MAG: aldo/keto reductase [Deltaproteobacteria bacterium]|nr:aldo/keto reductase [Deltaproteobacteria bacterium]MBW2052944.1 aldo/keto reductase [Deltaproteobacteria bacterium]MBW2141646.1 aldo/keto reductase [Deltaproteobacteria bacterium]
MKYKDFGNTGIKLSALGFGAMRLPVIGEGEQEKVDLENAVPVIQRGLDLGINYIDSAWAYHNGTSETAVGEAIAGRDRSSIYISTKNPLDTEVKEWRKRLDTQLERLNTDYIDFYHFHGLMWREFKKKVLPEGYFKELQRARDEGLIRHISFSCHDNPRNMIKLIDTGEFSSMLVQYNLLHRLNDLAIAHAGEKGMGVVVMGPVGGGRIAFLSRLQPREGRTVPELALRFVWSNPNINVALSGMGNVAMVEENAATADIVGPLTSVEEEDIQVMLDQLDGLEDLYCTGCGYCMPCPNGVDIPTNFLLLNYARYYEFGEGIAQSYNLGLKPAKASADFCIECEECLEKCPQNIPIPERMRDVVEQFSQEPQEDTDS